MKFPFAPLGGMNQDDSIITPTKNTAGKNAFTLGDYKYALNARIGSSRSDNFGDLENIKGTTEVDSYFIRSQTFSNPSFDGSIAGWSSIDIGTGNWGWIPNAAVISPESGDILYQNIAAGLAGRVGKISLQYTMPPATVTDFVLRVIFLQGTTVIGSQTISTQSSDDIVTIDADINIPSNCTGVGVQVYGTAVGISLFILYNFNLFGWASGSRPSGDEKVIGKREDKERNILYYVVYNSDANHCIRFFDPATNGVYEVLRWAGLNLQINSFVSIAIIDNWMAITDRSNKPRLFDVDTVGDERNVLGIDFREFHISFHRWAPVMPAVLKPYYDGATDNSKKLRYVARQWAYRYIYKGNLRSRWSPVSYVVNNAYKPDDASGPGVTGINIFIPGFLLDNPGAAVSYNYFNHTNVKFTNAITGIELAYREGQTDLWRIHKRHDVSAGNNNNTFTFEGEANSTPIPVNDFEQLFDTVPIKAGVVEAIDNRFVFADVVDEQEPANPIQVNDVGVVSHAGNAVNGNFLFGSLLSIDNTEVYEGMSSDDANELGFRNYGSRSTFKSRGKYKLGIQWLGENGWRSAVYTSDNWMYEIPEENEGVVNKRYALTFSFPEGFKPPSWAVAYQIMRTNCLNIDYFMFGPCNDIEPIIDDVTQDLDKANVPQSIIDKIRQRFENSQIVTGREYNDFLTSLKNNPFRFAIVSLIRKTAAASTVANASRLYINVNNWYNSSKANSDGTQNNPMNNLYYNFREGDRIRFVASTVATPTDAQKRVFDVEILEFTGRAIIVEKPEGILWLPSNNAQTDSQDHIIEVYTPKTPGQSDYIYYETGEWYPVLFPGTDQRRLSKRIWSFDGILGNVTCTTYGDVKVFNNRPFVFGDCSVVGVRQYFNLATPPGNSFVDLIGLVSMTPDEKRLFDGWTERNNGRPALSYSTLPVVKFKPTKACFGGQIVEESFINNINRFRDPDQFIYPSEYGRIRALINTSNAQVESVGAILLAIGERETFSIYVNRQTLEDLSGRTQVSISDRVLGSYNTLLGSHGTLNPESVSIDRGRVYFWDALDGCWVRYGRDGLTEISFYKMRNWFREIGSLTINQYNGVNNPVALSEFDAFNEELITFINHPSLPSTFRGYSSYKGSFFSEDDRRWKSCHSYEGEMLGRINNQVVLFKDGGVNLLESSNARSTFLGVKYDVKIEPVFTSEMLNESWQNISIIATHKWSVERFLSEYRGAKQKQESSISLQSMTEKEGNYYSEIKSDINTPVVANPLNLGDKMRSKALRTLLNLDPGVVTESLLHYVVVDAIDSPKNP